MDQEKPPVMAQGPIIPAVALTLGLKAEPVRPVTAGEKAFRVSDEEGEISQIFRFSAAGRLLAVEVYSKKGKIIRTETYDPASRVAQIQEGDRRCRRTPASLECEKEAAVFLQDVPAEDAVCRRPAIEAGTRAQIDSILADLDHFSLAPSGSPYTNANGLNEQAIGHNIVATGCASYGASNPDLSATPPGLSGPAGVADDVGKAIRDGLKCMKDNAPDSKTRIGGVAMVQEAAQRLTAFLVPGYSRPVRVACMPDEGASIPSYEGTYEFRKGTIASAHTDCTHGSFPILGLNLARSNQKGNRAYAAAFHELLHVAGYPHGTAVDLPYLISSCCMESQFEACTILKSNPTFNSTAYLTSFADYMVGTRKQPDIIQPVLMNAYRANTTATLPMAEGAARTLARLPGTPTAARADGWPMYYFMMGNLGMKSASNLNSPDGDRVFTALSTGMSRYYDVAGSASDRAIMRLAQDISTYLAESRTAPHGSFLLARIKSELASTCSTLAKNELWALNEFGKGTADLLPAGAQAETSQNGVNWSRPCGP